MRSAAPAPSNDLLRKWGIIIGEGRLDLGLSVANLGDRAESGRFRVGRTVLELTLRRSLGGLVLLLQVSFGPPIVMSIGLIGVSGVGLSVDGVALSGDVARFTAVGRHEIRWDELLAADPPPLGL